MNFQRGFNYGFKSSFSGSKSKFNFSNFFNKSSFNNKNIFNAFNSNCNSQNFRINFSNKYFMNRVNFLSNCSAISTECGSAFKKMIGEMKEGSSSESTETDSSNLITGNDLAMLNGVLVVRSGIILLTIDREVMEHINAAAQSRMRTKGNKTSKW